MLQFFLLEQYFSSHCEIPLKLSKSTQNHVISEIFFRKMSMQKYEKGDSGLRISKSGTVFENSTLESVLTNLGHVLDHYHLGSVFYLPGKTWL